MSYERAPWMTWVCNRFGPPKITPEPEGTLAGGARRWAWVWFPGQVSHGLHIEEYSPEHIDITIWGPERRLERTEHTMPTDVQMIASMQIIWDGPEAFERAIVKENW